MDLPLLSHFSTGIIVLLFLIQLLRRAWLAKHSALVFWLVVAVFSAILSYLTAQLYFSWLIAGPPSMYLLPPYQSISYFVFYAGVRIWLPYLLSLAFGGIAFLGAKYLNKRYDERFMHPEEYYFIALGIFLSVHPLWLLFLVLAASLYVLYALIETIRFGSSARTSFYYCWLPATLLTSLVTPLIPSQLMHLFKI